MIKVSCIVPAYKRVDQTVRTLELLLGSDQLGSVFELELIVADSTPDTSLQTAVVSRFGDKVTYVKPEKLGIAANKNAGAKVAKHPVLIFCDSDMEVEEHTLSDAIGSLKEHEKAAALGGTVMWRGGPQDGQKDRPRFEDRLMIRDATTFIEALYSRFLVTYKDIFWAVGGYDEQIFNMRGEGSDLSARFWRAGYPLVYEKAVTVHHVYDVPDAAAVRVKHAEWGIARDLLLLGYKYDMFNETHRNFMATVDIDFSSLGAEGYYRMLQGIGRNFDMLVSVKGALDAFRAGDKPKYDFKFLEVFSNTELFETCIDGAMTQLNDARAAAFGE